MEMVVQKNLFKSVRLPSQLIFSSVFNDSKCKQNWNVIIYFNFMKIDSRNL